MSEDIVFAVVPLFGISFGCILVLAAIWLGMKARMRRIELMTDLQNRVLDKFGTATEFVEFVRTPEGRQWMSTSADNGGPRQADRILSSLRWGLILACFGVAFLLLAIVDERDLVYPGFLIGSVGVGFLAHAFIATKLARKWGLMPGPSDRPAGE